MYYPLLFLTRLDGSIVKGTDEQPPGRALESKPFHCFRKKKLDKD